MGRATALAESQRRALARLKRVPGLRGFYLAGGSAIAFHLAHRRSYDLDLFSSSFAVQIEALAEEIAQLKNVKVVASSDATLKLRVGTVAVDIVRYRYPLVEMPSRGPEGFPIAGLLDLATMKLAAISMRGIYRDFWDLHEIMTRSSVTLAAGLDAYVQRFGVAKADLYHVLRSLTYFTDAEKERLPRGLSQSHWRAIKLFFEEEAPGALLRHSRQ
jgi:hypothetical protein